MGDLINRHVCAPCQFLPCQRMLSTCMLVLRRLTWACFWIGVRAVLPWCFSLLTCPPGVLIISFGSRRLTCCSRHATPLLGPVDYFFRQSPCVMWHTLSCNLRIRLRISSDSRGIHGLGTWCGPP